MNSSMAERPVVNGRVESSNLSSSAIACCDLDGKFGFEEIRYQINKNPMQANGRIAPMAESR
jgi:hypothetical protein